MLDVVIIGSGPAGLSAAIYGCRAGLDMVVLEKSPMSGGQILNTYEVDNYPGLPGIAGFDLGVQFREHAEKMGAKFVEAEALQIKDMGDHKEIVTEKETFVTKNVILATGAHHALLGVEGEERLNGRGVSYCATCDGAFFRNKTVAVVGGGDVAVEDAIYLARTSAKVYLIHRRNELRAAKILQNELMALPNVEILWDTQVKEINGEEVVESITVTQKDSMEEKTIEINGVFVAVGIHPDTELLQGIVAMDESGYVIADESCKTNVTGILVAGDARKKGLRQVITAAADGANAIASLS